MTLDKGYETKIVQVDLGATLDLVSHNAIIFKLKQNGIGSCFPDVLTDFLCDR